MPAYTLRIGEKSFWIDARSDEGAVGLTAASLADAARGDDEILLMTDPGERVVLTTTVDEMRGVSALQSRVQPASSVSRPIALAKTGCTGKKNL